MKRVFIISALLLSFVFVFAQAKDEPAIRQVLNEITSALKSRDVAALNRLWSDDYIFVSPAGKMFNKTQRAAAVSSSPAPEFFAYEDVKTRIFGNTAIVNAIVRLKNAGQDTSINLSSLVMVKNGGRWQVANGHGTVAAGNEAGSNDEQMIRQIEQELLDALLKGDISANERYQSDNYVFTGPDGLVMDKAKGNADIKSGVLKIVSSKIDDMKVQLFGNTAVATYRTADKGSYKGHEFSGQYRWTDTFVKQGGRWQLIASHGSPIAQK